MSGQKGVKRPPWSDYHVRTAAAIWQREFADLYGDGKGAVKPPFGHVTKVKQMIAHALHRSIASVITRFHDYGPSFDSKDYDVTAKPSPKPGDAEIQRRLRLAALDRRDLTGVILGDPPPGYSALDERKAGARS